MNKEWIDSLTELNRDNQDKLLKLHRELFGHGQDYCTSCPAQIRNAAIRIKKYYNES